jgi:hypothetical protein
MNLGTYGPGPALKAWLAGPAAMLSYLSGVYGVADEFFITPGIVVTALFWLIAGYGITFYVPNRNQLPPAAPTNEGDSNG